MAVKDVGDDSECHPLQDKWNFFVFNYSLGTSWEQRMQKVFDFATVERFWCLMYNTQPPSDIQNGTDLYVFKDGIQPMWEDPKNETGGRWLINIKADSDVNKYWEELLMLIVGNCWDHEEDAENICGAVFQPRARGSKISLWTSNYQDKDSTLRIGKRVKEALNYNDRLVFQTVEEQKTVPKGQDAIQGIYSL